MQKEFKLIFNNQYIFYSENLASVFQAILNSPVVTQLNSCLLSFQLQKIISKQDDLKTTVANETECQVCENKLNISRQMICTVVSLFRLSNKYSQIVGKVISNFIFLNILNRCATFTWSRLQKFHKSMYRGEYFPPSYPVFPEQ